MRRKQRKKDGEGEEKQRKREGSEGRGEERRERGRKKGERVDRELRVQEYWKHEEKEGERGKIKKGRGK